MTHADSQWRHPAERAELVERVVVAERRARVAEMKARALMDRDGVTHLAARVVELEEIVERLNAKLMTRRRAS